MGICVDPTYYWSGSSDLYIPTSFIGGRVLRHDVNTDNILKGAGARLTTAYLYYL